VGTRTNWNVFRTDNAFLARTMNHASGVLAQANERPFRWLEANSMFVEKKRHFLNLLLCEEGIGQAEEPDQRWHHGENRTIMRHEKIRCLVSSCSLLMLFLSFLSLCLTHNYLPLFFSILLIFIGYRCFDAYLCSRENTLSS
jgi:hypothetical protein